jgi:glycerophosphoryl diester phosphodiesterase
MRSIFLIFVFLSACSRGPSTAPYLVAHRGASAIAPENTLAAFELAWSQGASNVEGDFYVSLDGRIVCIHDKHTERTGSSKLPVSGTVSSELRQLDVGAWKGSRWAGERIPYLEEVLQTIPKHGRLLLEIKCGLEILPLLAEVLSNSKLRAEQVDLICFDKDVIAAAKKIMPDHAAWWLVSFKEEDGAWFPRAEDTLATLERIGAEGLGCNAKLEVVTKDFANKLHARGFGLNVWTVNDPSFAKELIERGADLITTDRPLELSIEINRDAFEVTSSH